MRNRLVVLLGLVAAGFAVPVQPSTATDGYLCAGNSRPQVCAHQILGFGGEVREYGVTTGGPAGSGTEAYRLELLCGGGAMALRVGETEHGLGLGIGFQTFSLVIPSLVCPDVFRPLPQIPQNPELPL